MRATSPNCCVFMLMMLTRTACCVQLSLCVPACSSPTLVLISGAVLPLRATLSLSPFSGGAGYIGSHTCVELIKAGEKVRGCLLSSLLSVLWSSGYCTYVVVLTRNQTSANAVSSRGGSHDHEHARAQVRALPVWCTLLTRIGVDKEREPVFWRT